MGKRDRERENKQDTVRSKERESERELADELDQIAEADREGMFR